jgi:hypothetical protein
MKTASLEVDSRRYHVMCTNFVVMRASTISLFYKRLVRTFPKSQLEQEYREGLSRVGKKHGKGYESTEARSLTALSVKVEATLFRIVVFSLYVSFSSCRDKHVVIRSTKKYPMAKPYMRIPAMPLIFHPPAMCVSLNCT